jgi:hypothetical protein
MQKFLGENASRPPTVKYDTKKALKYAAIIIGDLRFGILNYRIDCKYFLRRNLESHLT